MSENSLIEKRAIRARALRAAQAVAIVATLTGAGCSSRTEPMIRTDAGSESDSSVADSGAGDLGSDSGDIDLGASDAGLVDSGAVDAGMDAALADAGVDLGTEDFGVIEEPDLGVNPCIDESGEIDWECCSAMGFPPGCPVIGPFVPPAMDVA